MTEYFILLICLIVAIAFYTRFKSFFKALCLGSFSGLFGLVAAGYFAANYISFSIFTVLVSLIAGIPGVLSLALFNAFSG